MYEFLWFLGGAITYKFLSTLLGITQITHVIQQLQINILTFLGTTLEDIAYIKALKYKTMKEHKVDPNQIKKAEMRDEEFFEEWKNSCIENIHKSVPSYIRLSFDDWQGGMTLLDEAYRRRIREKEKEQ
jgi:predicted thioredoxin/glutaredoxin